MDWYWYPLLYMVIGLATALWDVYRDARDKGKTDAPADYVLDFFLWPALFAVRFGSIPFQYAEGKGEAIYDKRKADAKALEDYRKAEKAEEDRLFAIAE